MVRTNEAGAVIADSRVRYDAWGKRESGTSDKRGYTGHEMLDDLGLIHMNGRVYDPVIGKFLSADPFIQFPESTQGFNRYAYVGNNPLSANDPSGHFLVAIYMLAQAAATQAVAWQLNAAVVGMLTMVETGGNVKASALAALSVVAAGSIGDKFGHQLGFGDKNFLTKAFLHGVSQGAISQAGGGRFGDGFLGGFAGSVTAPLTRGVTGRISRVVASAVIGGTVSAIGGGRFANGARSAAFVTLFNDLSSVSTRGPTTPKEAPPPAIGDDAGVDLNGQTVRNPRVLEELGKLRQGLNKAGYRDVAIVATGGESYFDPESGESISLTNGDVIPNRLENSAHHVENGARGVDLRRPQGIEHTEFDTIVRENSDFKNNTNDYADQHEHLGLKNTAANNCPVTTCVVN